jgi:GAF domain
MIRSENLTEHQLSAIVPPEPDNRCDQELVRWFALHGGVWSGTASELLAAVRTRVDVGNDLWPRSSRALYAHLESHRQILRSLGVDVWLRQGYPRIVTLRSCLDEKPAITPPSVTSGINPTDDPPANLPPLADEQKTRPDSGEVSPAANETFSQDIPTAKSELAERCVNGRYADGDNVEGRVFENTGEVLFAVVEMQARIREQGLDLRSATDLVVGRTQEITRSSGVAVAWFQQDNVVYAARTGIAATMAGLHFHSSLFQSCLRTGEGVQLQNAQKHSLLGTTCRLEGIKSLIIVPIFRNRVVAGVIELLFKEMRSFSTGDVMDLELITGVISEGSSEAAQIESRQGRGRECPANTKAIENIQPRLGHPSNRKAGLVDAQPSPSRDTIDAETSFVESASPEPMVLGLLASKLATAPTLLWLAFKKAWMRCIRAV